MKVLYCTLLASAQNSDERRKIEEKMRNDSELSQILDSLEHETDKSEKSEEKKTRKGKSGDSESRSVKRQDENDVEMSEESEGKGKNGDQWNPQQMLNLEDLQFSQGGHFMANKKCQLPEGSFRKQKKGYEEVHVPAAKPRTVDKEVRKIISINLFL